MTQLLRGLLASTFLATLVFLSVLLFNKSADQPTVEREKCPFAQEDYIYWSKKYKLAWCKVSLTFSVASMASRATCIQQGCLGYAPTHGDCCVELLHLLVCWLFLLLEHSSIIKNLFWIAFLFVAFVCLFLSFLDELPWVDDIVAIQSDCCDTAVHWVWGIGMSEISQI